MLVTASLHELLETLLSKSMAAMQAALDQHLLVPQQLTAPGAAISLELLLGPQLHTLLSTPVEIIAWSDEEGIRCSNSLCHALPAK